MKRIIAVLSALMLLLFTFTGCAANPGKDQIKVGMTLYGMENEFMIIVSDAAKKAANDLGLSLDVYDGKYDANIQLSQVETMITNGVDVIIMAPQDYDACVPCVDAAVKANIPMVIVNCGVNSEKIKCYVGANDVTGGELEMQYLIDYMKSDEFNIVIFEGPLGSTGQLNRSKGIENVLASYPKINVLAADTANWSRSEAMTLMESWLVTYGGKIDAVVAQNDEMGLGARNAIEAAGFDIPVIGIDGIDDALDAIENDRMIASFFQDGYVEGYKAVETAQKIAMGENIDGNIYVEFELITKDNVADYRNK